MFYLWLCVTSYLEKFIIHATFCNNSSSNSAKHKIPFNRFDFCIFESFEVLVKYLRINVVYVFCHIRLAPIYPRLNATLLKSLFPILHLYTVYWNIPAAKTKQKQKQEKKNPKKNNQSIYWKFNTVQQLRLSKWRKKREGAARVCKPHIDKTEKRQKAATTFK